MPNKKPSMRLLLLDVCVAKFMDASLPSRNPYRFWYALQLVKSSLFPVYTSRCTLCHPMQSIVCCGPHASRFRFPPPKFTSYVTFRC